MKCSKQFATTGGQSHLPSNMINIPNINFFSVTTPEGEPIVIFELTRRTTETPTVFKVRMNVHEAENFIRDLRKTIDNTQRAKHAFTPSEINPDTCGICGKYERYKGTGH